MKLGFLFDLDGVLIDSENEYTRIWSEIDAHFPTGVAEFAQAIKGTTLESILHTYFKKEDVEAVKTMLRAKESQMRYNYCEGAEQLLHTLRAKHIPIAIVTSSKKDKMANLRRQHPELFDQVDAIVDADSVTRSKPDPQGYLIGAEKIGIPAENCIVVEDSIQGVQAGKAAGCFVVGMTATFGRHQMEGHADLILDSLTELQLDTLSTLLKQKS